MKWKFQLIHFNLQKIETKLKTHNRCKSASLYNGTTYHLVPLFLISPYILKSEKVPYRQCDTERNPQMSKKVAQKWDFDTLTKTA